MVLVIVVRPIIQWESESGDPILNDDPFLLEMIIEPAYSHASDLESDDQERPRW